MRGVSDDQNKERQSPRHATFLLPFLVVAEKICSHVVFMQRPDTPSCCNKGQQTTSSKLVRVFLIAQSVHIDLDGHATIECTILRWHVGTHLPGGGGLDPHLARQSWLDCWGSLPVRHRGNGCPRLRRAGHVV